MREGGSGVANYVLVYKGGGMPETEAQRQQVMAAWGQWFGSLGQDMVDGGNPFAGSKSISSDGTVDGPGGSALTGYSIIKADSLDQAAQRAKGCPILSSGGSIEVYETFNVM
jgi:hypothetical protein